VNSRDTYPCITIDLNELRPRPLTIDLQLIFINSPPFKLVAYSQPPFIVSRFSRTRMTAI
jgi:hypothetical protein